MIPELGRIAAHQAAELLVDGRTHWSAAKSLDKAPSVRSSPVPLGQVDPLNASRAVAVPGESRVGTP